MYLVVHMELGVEGGPLGVDLVSAEVGDVTPSDVSLRSVTTKDEITTAGGTVSRN